MGSCGRGVGMVGGWWEGSVWLVEREVLGWWGGTEEGAAGGKGWTLSIPIYSTSFYPFQKPAVLSVFIAWLSLQILKLRAAFTVAWMPMLKLGSSLHFTHYPCCNTICSKSLF